MKLAPPDSTSVPLVIIGASTGGTRVLPAIFRQLDPVRACFIIVQHLPASMSGHFCRTLSLNSSMPVRIICDRDRIESGTVMLVPGDCHCTLSGNRVLRLDAGEKVNFVCPSADVTMMSVSHPAPSRLCCVVLTGMGRDGAAGLRHMKGLGAVTIAQDEASCAVFGMPAEAIRTGCVDHVLTPDRIAELLGRFLR